MKIKYLDHKNRAHEIDIPRGYAIKLFGVLAEEDKTLSVNSHVWVDYKGMGSPVDLPIGGLALVITPES